jgi:hypothetical protein
MGLLLLLRFVFGFADGEANLPDHPREGAARQEPDGRAPGDAITNESCEMIELLGFHCDLLRTLWVASRTSQGREAVVLVTSKASQGRRGAGLMSLWPR